jgi:N-acetyl sugar amidotransferase
MQLKCPKCHYPVNHPFGLIINKKECSGCITHIEKDTLNWENKGHELESIVKVYKKNKNHYNCVVPVNGDAEDYYTISRVLKLGLSPLVVYVNDYFKNDIGWYNFHNLITYFDVDSFTFNPDIRVYKDLIRTSLRKYDHILLPSLQLSTSFPIHIAKERNIPLVVWGQNQAIEQVGKFSHHDEVEMSRWYRREHDLFNVEIKDLIGNGAQVNEDLLNYYKYPNIKLLNKNGIKGLYLSNYMRWDPLDQNRKMRKYGFMPEKNQSTFDIYERAGSSVYYKFHDLLKYKRNGYRKINDHVAREIRHARLTSKEGQELIEQYMKNQIDIKPFFKWIGSTKSGYEWYLKERLSDVRSLVGTETEKIEIPMGLKKMLEGPSKNPERNYITYHKGLDI